MEIRLVFKAPRTKQFVTTVLRCTQRTQGAPKTEDVTPKVNLEVQDFLRDRAEGSSGVV